MQLFSRIKTQNLYIRVGVDLLIEMESDRNKTGKFFNWKFFEIKFFPGDSGISVFWFISVI